MSTILNTADVSTLVSKGRVFDLVHSENFGGDLRLVSRFGLKDDGSCETVRLSADDRHWDDFDGLGDLAAGEEPVYVELIRADGTGYHGYVGSDSRKLIQVG